MPADPAQATMLRRSRRLADVLELAEALPFRRTAATGQVRLWWDDTPVDLFLDDAPLHCQAAAGSRDVPFAGRQIRVPGPVEIILFKALFAGHRTGSTSRR